ncbi:hypothetical protein GCM10010439_40850 [Actinocorallia aurantiaca]|uniref:Uncharacterized protein n=1 Tax=Actinocorallia aurantiaca TaxID=46204 RepID=A0ABP6GR38_9ACTN
MRDDSRIQQPRKVTVPGFESSQEAALPAKNTSKKSGRKSLLKGTDQRSAALGRNAMGRNNARRLPTRQMNNRGGR